MVCLFSSPQRIFPFLAVQIGTVPTPVPVFRTKRLMRDDNDIYIWLV